jgi:hypothetical protein
MKIEARHASSGDGARPWLVYIDGEMVTTKRGNGRRFVTQEAAEKAARTEIERRAEQAATGRLAAAVREVEAAHPLPRCRHGVALRDGGGERLEPSCGCRAP